MINLKQLVKTYTVGHNIIPVLSCVNLAIKTGEYVAIMGASGSGKSTLLNVLGILDSYDSGSYRLQNQLIKQLSETEAALLRSQLIGFVFQSFNLISFKNALDNVSLPLYYRRVGRKQRDHKARALLEQVGLTDRALHYPAELSGGQRQRVAIARALVNDPPLILADEPTGSLDSVTSTEIMTLFSDIHQTGKTLVLITHDEQVANQANRIIHIQDGHIQDVK